MAKRLAPIYRGNAAPRHALPSGQEEPWTRPPSRPSPTQKGPFEELKVTGENLLKTVRELIHEGNVRRISIRNEQGHTLLEIPLAFGLVGALFAPVWAAVGAMAAMATGFSIIVERKRRRRSDPSDPSDGQARRPPDA